MSKTNNSSSSGIGFFGLLTILFIGLKLTNYIDWSWFWVLSPIIFPTLSVVFGIIVLFIVTALTGFFEKSK